MNNVIGDNEHPVDRVPSRLPAPGLRWTAPFGADVGAVVCLGGTSFGAGFGDEV